MMLGNSAPADTLDIVRYTLHAAVVTHMRLFLFFIETFPCGRTGWRHVRDGTLSMAAFTG